MDPRASWLLSPIVLGMWLGVVFGYLYVELIGQPMIERRRALLEAILRCDVKSDYLYATYGLAHVQHFISSNTPLGDTHTFALIDMAGIVCLFTAAGLFLQSTFVGLPSRLSGMLWLGVTSPFLLLRQHFYHPSDFYATALMFAILFAAKRGRWLQLALLCLISGALWEKTLFVPFVFLLWEARRSGVRNGVLRALPALAATLLCFTFWRVEFPETERVHAHATWAAFLRTLPLAAIDWLVWLGPIFLLLVDMIRGRRRVDRFWLCWLLYVPLLACVIFAVRGQMRELRSFWICQPILVGLVASWMASRGKKPTSVARNEHARIVFRRVATSAVPVPAQPCGTLP